ncbi:hypothetical protein ACFVUS_40830 [Nocardia sp. NPDC058058]|uniref:hypothetical protein n=1 Tax=Nocardia sp. NPDC058058 TaxID=3346317 RepID=UPI0036DDD1D9
MNDTRFEHIMGLLRERIPSLADELDQDFRLGRAVPVRAVPHESDMRERSKRLADNDLQPLGRADMVVVPYSDDERGTSINEALLTLAETMYRSRLALLKTATAHGMDTTIQFGDPEFEEPSRIDLSIEVERARVARDLVRTLLSGGSISGKEMSDE